MNLTPETREWMKNILFPHSLKIAIVAAAFVCGVVLTKAATALASTSEYVLTVVSYDGSMEAGTEINSNSAFKVALTDISKIHPFDKKKRVSELYFVDDWFITNPQTLSADHPTVITIYYKQYEGQIVLQGIPASDENSEAENGTQDNPDDTAPAPEVNPEPNPEPDVPEQPVYPEPEVPQEQPLPNPESYNEARNKAMPYQSPILPFMPEPVTPSAEALAMLGGEVTQL